MERIHLCMFRLPVQELIAQCRPIVPRLSSRRRRRTTPAARRRARRRSFTRPSAPRSALPYSCVAAAAVLAGVLDAAIQQVADHPIEGGAKIDPSRVDPASERVRGLMTIFRVLSYDTIFWALVLAVLAYFALRGGRTTRILAAIILGFSELVLAANRWLSYPMLAKATSGLASILALAAIVLFFLPASNAYGRIRRAAKAAGRH